MASTGDCPTGGIASSAKASGTTAIDAAAPAATNDGAKYLGLSDITVLSNGWASGPSLQGSVSALGITCGVTTVGLAAGLAGGCAVAHATTNASISQIKKSWVHVHT